MILFSEHTSDRKKLTIWTEDQAPESTQDDFKNKNKCCKVQDRAEKSH